jgi:shikimate kinase
MKAIVDQKIRPMRNQIRMMKIMTPNQKMKIMMAKEKEKRTVQVLTKSGKKHKIVLINAWHRCS